MPETRTANELTPDQLDAAQMCRELADAELEAVAGGKGMPGAGAAGGTGAPRWQYLGWSYRPNGGWAHRGWGFH